MIRIASSLFLLPQILSQSHFWRNAAGVCSTSLCNPLSLLKAVKGLDLLNRFVVSSHDIDLAHIRGWINIHASASD